MFGAAFSWRNRKRLSIEVDKSEEPVSGADGIRARPRRRLIGGMPQ
jgi:hypothetical protein